MKRIIYIAILLTFTVTGAFAQAAGAGASQTTNLQLSDAIELSLLTSSTVAMEFNTVNDYANGIESDEHTFQVKSNKKFVVRVKVQSSYFTYMGSSADPKMKTNSVLKFKIASNNTGGTLTSGYSNYKALSTSGSKVINNGSAGGNNTFSVKYKATPGFTYPAGTYTVDVVYTATQS